jgi:hypothetical protein
MCAVKRTSPLRACKGRNWIVFGPKDSFIIRLRLLSGYGCSEIGHIVFYKLPNPPLSTNFASWGDKLKPFTGVNTIFIRASVIKKF